MIYLHPWSPTFALVALLPVATLAQEDAYLSCPEEVACYTSDGCHRGRAGALFFTVYDDGQRIVVEGLGGDPLVMHAVRKNVYQIDFETGVWLIVLADDWTRYYMVQALPQMQDAAAITGPCERRPA